MQKGRDGKRRSKHFVSAVHPSLLVTRNCKNGSYAFLSTGRTEEDRQIFSNCGDKLGETDWKRRSYGVGIPVANKATAMLDKLRWKYAKGITAQMDAAVS